MSSHTTSTPTRGASPSRVSTSPAPARTDSGGAASGPGATTASVGPASGLTASGAARVGTVSRRTVSRRTVRRHALPLVLGAVTWSVSSFVFGFNTKTAVGITVQDLSGFAFQVGVMSLVLLQLRTAATGTGRGARIMLRVEQVLLTLAMVWSLVHGLVPSVRDAGWLAVLDIFWPLSMLGMFVIAIKIAVAGRWRGLARWWPLVAESWAVVSVPTFILSSQDVADVVGGTHLLLGYTTLGLILMARPHLVGARG